MVLQQPLLLRAPLLLLLAGCGYDEEYTGMGERALIFGEPACTCECTGGGGGGGGGGEEGTLDVSDSGRS